MAPDQLYMSSPSEIPVNHGSMVNISILAGSQPHDWQGMPKSPVGRLKKWASDPKQQAISSKCWFVYVCLIIDGLSQIRLYNYTSQALIVIYIRISILTGRHSIAPGWPPSTSSASWTRHPSGRTWLRAWKWRRSPSSCCGPWLPGRLESDTWKIAYCFNTYAKKHTHYIIIYYYIILYYIMLCYVMLYYIVLYCIILYCIILYI